MKNNRAIRRQQRIAERRESRRAARAGIQADTAIENQDPSGSTAPDALLLELSWHAAEPPEVAARRPDLLDWVASAKPFCPLCASDGRCELLVIGADAAGRFDTTGCIRHGSLVDMHDRWPLAVYGPGDRLAAQRDALTIMARAWREAELRARAADQQFFLAHPGRQWRARPTLTPWEGYGQASSAGQRYAIVQRGAPNHQRAVVVVADPGFDLSCPPAEFPDAMIDAYCRQLVAKPSGTYIVLTPTELGGGTA